MKSLAYLVILFLFPLFAFAQIIPNSNQVDWSIAGYDGTIPNPPNSINVKTDHGAVGDGITNDGPAIQAAIDAATTGDVVYLPSGTYLLQNQLVMKDFVIIRGDCAGGTILNFDLGGRSEACIDLITYQYGNYVAAVSGYTKDSDVLNVANAAGFTVGSYGQIRQDNDPALMYTSPDWNVSWAEKSVGQMFEVMAINGNQITIAPPLTLDYNSNLNPDVRPIGLREGVGIEDLAIERLDNGDHYTIDMKNTANCWVKNVESYNTDKSHIWASQALYLEITENFFHHAHDYGGGGHGYGVTLGNYVTACLVENNIFKYLRHAMMVKQGATLNVFGYNYSIEPYWGNPSNIPPDISLHGHYPNMNLFEGNVVQELTSADYWGPSGPGNTFFRNRVATSDILIKDASHAQNLVGNELNAGSTIIDIEPSVNNTLEHGNNENGTINWENGLTQDLPNSYYLTGIPDFWNAQPFPNIGPEFTLGSGVIPAQERYHNGLPNACNFLLDDTVLSLETEEETSEKEEEIIKLNLHFFPNPVSDKLYISYQLPRDKKVVVVVTNVLGMDILTQDFGKQQAGEGQWTLDSQTWLPGLYAVKVQVGQQTFLEWVLR